MKTDNILIKRETQKNFTLSENELKVTILEYDSYNGSFETINTQTVKRNLSTNNYESCNFNNLDDFYLNNINEETMGIINVNDYKLNLENGKLDLKLRMVIPYNYLINELTDMENYKKLRTMFKFKAQNVLYQLKEGLNDKLELTENEKFEEAYICFYEEDYINSLNGGINTYNRDKLQENMRVVKYTYEIESKKINIKDKFKNFASYQKKGVIKTSYIIKNIISEDKNHPLNFLKGQQISKNRMSDKIYATDDTGKKFLIIPFTNNQSRDRVESLVRMSFMKILMTSNKSVNMRKGELI